MRLGGEARKRCGLTVALRPWAWGLRCRRRHRGGVAGPRPLEHEAQPHQGDQHQLVKQEMGNHGTTPSDRWSNEGIVPGFQTAGISRSLEVHDQSFTHIKMSQPFPACLLGMTTSFGAPAPTSGTSRQSSLLRTKRYIKTPRRDMR